MLFAFVGGREQNLEKNDCIYNCVIHFFRHNTLSNYCTYFVLVYLLHIPITPL